MSPTTETRDSTYPESELTEYLRSINHPVPTQADLPDDDLSDADELAAEAAADVTEEIDGEAPFNFTDFFLLLFLAGIPGLIIGYGSGLLCAGFAVLLNVVHNLSPAYFFVMPLIIVLFMAISPVVYGMGMGKGIGTIAQLIKSRNVGTAAFVGLAWGILGIYIFPYFAQLGTPDGTVFFKDILMPFVNKMVGAALHFEWLTEPTPANVPASVVQWIWWVGGILGVIMACGGASEVVEDKPEEPVRVYA